MTSTEQHRQSESLKALIRERDNRDDTISQLRLERDAMYREHADLKAKLAAFEEAMEKETKPDWSKSLKECADRVDELARQTVPTNSYHETLRNAAINLRYMADSFTLKANFVSRDLRIKELEAKLAQVEATAQRRLELLRKCEWPVRARGCTYCIFCNLAEPIHKPDCPLTKELKENK